MQAHVLRLAPDAADLAVSMFSGLYNVGIGAGALLGKVVARDFGLSWTGTFGAIVGVVSTVVCGLAFVASNYFARRDAHALAD